MDLQIEEQRLTRERNAKIDARAGAAHAHMQMAEKYLGDLTREVPLAIDWLQGDRRNPLNAYAPVLRGLDPAVIALCALQLGLLSISRADDVGETDRTLGTALLGEITNAVIDDDQRKAIIKEAKQQHCASRVQQVEYALAAAKRLGVFKAEDAIDNVTLRHIGAFLRSLLLSSLPDLFVMSEDHCHLNLTDEAQPVLAALVETALDRNPVFLPMRQQPLAWRDLKGGGPIDGRQRGIQVVRTRVKKTKRAVKESAKAGTMEPLFGALNKLQSTAWRINADVLGAIEACEAAGLNVKGIPKKRKKRVTLKGMFPGVKSIDDLNDKDKSKFMSERAKVRAYNAKQTSVDCGLKITLKTAHMMQGAPYFTPMNCDFRGRVYGISAFNFQKEDTTRAMFELAHGEPLGPRGLYWLKVQVANTWGKDNGHGKKTDKLPFEERVQWVDENLSRITRLPGNYLTDTWWTKASKPFMLLAASFALTSAMSSGEPSTYCCHLPVSCDGSCSGIQHLSLLTRSESEASLVNLLPSTAPADIYATVATRVSARVTADAGRAEWPSGEEWKGEVARMYLAHGVTRDECKRGVMTFAYSSQEHGMGGQIQEDLMQELTDEVIEDKRKEHPFYPYHRGTNDKPGKAARYLAHHLYASIQEVIFGPAGAMTFLQRVAKALAHEGQCAKWTTPVGLPWINYYHEVVVETVQLWMYDKGVRKRSQANVATGETNEVKKAKVANAISPNFVHALDASHLLLTAAACPFDVATVHDSFGCLPSRVDDLRRVLLATLVSMYADHDVLAEILAQAHEDITDANRHRLPELPIKGTLDLNQVLEARYAFA